MERRTKDSIKFSYREIIMIITIAFSAGGQWFGVLKNSDVIQELKEQMKSVTNRVNWQDVLQAQINVKIEAISEKLRGR